MSFFDDYAYPEFDGDMKVNNHGWFSTYHKELFEPLVKDKSLVLEIGSWMGLSTRFWLDHSDANVICIDTWEGSQEHKRKNDKRLDTLYQQFLVNQSEWKNRVFPMRMSSIKGLLELQKYPDIKPDFIYIDGSHEFEDVYLDVSICYNAYPEATITGDDWNWQNEALNNRKTVREAVTLFMERNDVQIKTLKSAWHFIKPE